MLGKRGPKVVLRTSEPEEGTTAADMRLHVALDPDSVSLEVNRRCYSVSTVRSSDPDRRRECAGTTPQARHRTV